MNEKTMGAIPVSALERLEQSAVKLSLITFCLRHEELKAAGHCGRSAPMLPPAR